MLSMFGFPASCPSLPFPMCGLSSMRFHVTEIPSDQSCLFCVITKATLAFSLFVFIPMIDPVCKPAGRSLSTRLLTSLDWSCYICSPFINQLGRVCNQEYMNHQECATPNTLSMGCADGENSHHVVQCSSCTFPAHF